MSPKCSMSSAPSIGTGSPICSKGAGRLRNRQPTRRANARDCGVGGRAPPHPTPVGPHFNLPAAKLGTSGSQWSLCPSPCLWTPPVARWLSGKRELPVGFQGLGEGQRCQPLGPSPILFASKFLSNTFWGFPQPPTPDLSWKVWVPLFLPWEGLEWDRKLGVFGALCVERGVGSFRAWYLSRAWEWGGSLFTPDLHCFSPIPAQLLAVFLLSHSVMATGEKDQGLRGGLLWGPQELGTGLGP